MRPLLLAFAFLLFVSAAEARLIRVPADQPTIAAGIGAAVRGDVVEIACGTYFERNLPMKSGIVVRSATGDPACVTLDGQNLGRGFLVQDCDATTEISGLTIKSCTSALDNQRGGGMWLIASSATIRRCVFQSCTGTYGGGLCSQNGSQSPSILECRFQGNTNGIVTLGQTHVLVHRCVFAGPSQGISCYYSGTLRVTRSTFASTGIAAGGLIVSTVETSVFYGATATVDTARCCVTNSTITAAVKTNVIVANPLLCTPNGPDYYVQSNSPCLQATGACAGVIGAYGAGCGPAPPVSVTVTTSIPGLPILVDGVSRTTPTVLSWYPMSEHTVSIDSTIADTSTSRYRFVSWSDGGTRSHYVVLPAGTTSLVASVRKQYKVKTIAFADGPGVGGKFVPADPWGDEGVPFELFAEANPGSGFADWTGTGAGSYTGTANPAILTLSGTVTQRAHFKSLGYEFSISASDVDPHVNESAPTGGFRALSLWLTCSFGGLSAFEAQVTGSLPYLGFVPDAGVLNAGSGNHLLLAIADCPTGSAVNKKLGTIYVTDSGGALCLGPWGSLPVAAVNCLSVPELIADPGVTGFSSSEIPCRTGTRGCNAIEFFGKTTTAVNTITPPADFAIEGIRPNPFGTDCTVSFSIPARQRATLTVYDVAGRRVATLIDGEVEAGKHERLWNGRTTDGVSARDGVYFVRLEADGRIVTKRIVRVSATR